MYLKKFIYVNWGNIPQLEFEFGPICLFSGGNGSGKTTAADAIQTVMTAAHDHVFHFNPGQDEATQRGRGKQVRTLASYVLGCDDGSYARPQGCDGYLAAIFHPSKGETGKPFTALLSLRAHLETSGSQKVARLDDCTFYLLPNHELTLSDLVKEDTASRMVLPSDKVVKQLKSTLGAEAVERFDRKKAYLCRLYGALRGRSDSVNEREALNAARAFARFMAYKPVKSINEFVAQEILEYRDLGEAIRTVSSLLKTIHAMEKDARQLRETIESLGEAEKTAGFYREKWLDFSFSHYTQARHQLLDAQQRYLTAKNEQADLQEQAKKNEKERELTGERRSQCRDQSREMEARRLGIPALRTKDELETKLANQQQQLQQLAPGVLQQDQTRASQVSAAKGFVEAALELNTLSQKESGKIPEKALAPCLHAAQTLVKASYNGLDLALPEILGRDWVDLSPLESKLDSLVQWQSKHNQWAAQIHERRDEGDSFRETLIAIQREAVQQEQQLARSVVRKQQEIEQLGQHKSQYPAGVRAALEAIQQEFPEADARVLCDYVEVKDSAWQSAIEGYLGGARFGIIVDEDYEADAISLVRRLPGRDQRARVIQGSKARRDAERLTLSDGSIVHLMTFEHETARHFLIASYGNVEQARDAQALRNTRRGLTKNGMGSGNYAMFRCDMPDGDLAFGGAGRERAGNAKAKEVVQLQQQLDRHQAQTVAHQRLLQAVDTIAPLQLVESLQQLLQLHRELRAVESSLTSMDVSDFSELDEQLAQLRQQEQQYDEQLGSLQKQSGQLEVRIKQLGRQCQILSDEQETAQSAWEDAEEQLRQELTHLPAETLDARLQSADAEADNHKAVDLINQHNALKAELGQASHALLKAVMEHNQQCREGEQLTFDPDFAKEHSAAFLRDVLSVEQQLDVLLNRLKNNILAQKHDKLQALKASFNHTFVSNLCHSIYQAINEGKRILDDLNRELEHHRFGADRERFRFDWEWLPEYKEYWTFFEEVIHAEQGQGDTLFNQGLSKQSRTVRDRLMAMLLDEDEHKALRELERIADYRNYRNYEIYKEPQGKAPIALSQYGTGSGGQLETPAYIIRSAAITSAFRFNEGKAHLRMVLVDEAFSKMDEHRSREVIQYLTESLGLQLMFIMPTSKSGPFMDVISNQFIFTKCPIQGKVGELSTRVLVDRQVCNQEKIQALWSQHRTNVRQQAELDFMAAFDE